MRFPPRPRSARGRLRVEQLEDRAVPAGLLTPALVGSPGVAGALGEPPAGPNPGRVNVVMAAATGRPADAAELAAAPFAAKVEYLGFGIYCVTLDAGTTTAAAVAYYSEQPGVAEAAPDETIRVERVPNDPSYGTQYGMNRIAGPSAWETATGSPGFVVAVIDTGIDYTHPDLAANVWTNPGEVAGNGIDDDDNGYVDDTHGWDFANDDNDPFDDNGHGTHVAGIIGAVGNNGVGVTGVNWSADLMALKFLTAAGSGATSNAIQCLDYAVMMGVKVSNNSWGGGAGSPALAAAIGRAREAGHIFVAAAGNSGQNIDTTPAYPAAYSSAHDNMVVVAASNSTDRLAKFSNYGAARVTLTAPGVGVLSTLPGDAYGTFSGTSMATPHVTGAIALFWSQHPTLTYTQVVNKLKATVDPVPWLAGKVQTGGRLNVNRLMDSVAGPPPTSPPPPASPPPASPPPPAPGPVVTGIFFTGNGSADLGSLRVTFDRPANPATFTAADIAFTGPAGAAVDTNYAIGPVGAAGTAFDVTFARQTAPGSYRVVIGPDIRDAAGHPMNQNGNGRAGEAGDAYTATTILTPPAAFTAAASGLPKALRPHTTTRPTVTVTQAVRVTDLNVTVSLAHPRVAALTIRLRGPDGSVVTLFLGNGRGGADLTNTVFDDEAGRGISAGAAPFTGPFRPVQALAAFDGKLATGTWTLEVINGSARDTGVLTGWALTVAGTAGGGGGPGVLGFPAAPPAPAAGGLAAGREIGWLAPGGSPLRPIAPPPPTEPLAWGTPGAADAGPGVMTPAAPTDDEGAWNLVDATGRDGV